MKPTNESFEEMQRRVTGQPPGSREKLRRLIRQTGWSKIIVPALMFAIMSALISRDVLDSLGLPRYTFILIGVVVFIVIFFLTLLRESGRSMSNDEQA